MKVTIYYISVNFEERIGLVVEGGKNQLKNEGMHAGAKADKFAFARVLRDTETPQERKVGFFKKQT